MISLYKCGLHNRCDGLQIYEKLYNFFIWYVNGWGILKNPITHVTFWLTK